MSNYKVIARRKLLERWRVIQDEDEEDEDEDQVHHHHHHRDNNAAAADPSKVGRHLCQLKEDWFADAFNFLISSPKEDHIWCGSWDLMGPLLETFYNYFKDEQHDSPLKVLWKRISEELQQCMRCISQHHQAVEMYVAEYESSSIGPLLDVLSLLDEERVTNHLKEINAKLARGEFDPDRDNAKIVSTMYEVLMFPVLLDDQSLINEFQIFIEALEDSHELTLAGNQQYPGVYALLFLKSRKTRSIGFRLAGYMGKLRKATDLDPLHTLLKKCISVLETEAILTAERPRPRMQLERATVWLGFKALLGFMEPPAFEEGILERYPSFLSIVLNHICDDSPEFSYAVNCLRLLFEMLGGKLWLRAALSPSVMRDTLLGQCFHTQNEKSHKDIFDLFQPFLQSLEALQDGEHEKQRRHFLYFLLHQVTVSSNFSMLMRKKACQIALRIIHRGYKLTPPCPPFECAHMWGPSLVSSLKDSSLHISLRQPAFDLVETILVSDAAALVTLVLNSRMPESTDRSISIEFKDEDDEEELSFAQDVEQKDICCWNEFSVQNQNTSLEFGWWMCIPMLWFDVLAETDPSALPVSFSKAVFWALSRLSIVAPQTSTEMSLPVRNWLAIYVPDILHLLGWKIPSGSDDGGVGKESKNSVKVSAACIPLIRTFKRLTAHFAVRMEQGEIRKQWTWEPRMAESLILLLVDPDDNGRQVGRRILEHVSNTRGLLCGLQFICSYAASLSAVFRGLRHALQLVQIDSVLLQFQSLHHFFFVLYKLLKEGVKSGESLPGSSSVAIDILTQGGFLRQPVFDSITENNDHLLKVDPTSWRKFSFLISEAAWPSFCKCLATGKTFVDDKISQMSCIRLLEIFPVVLERLGLSVYKNSGILGIMVESDVDFEWLHDLMDWGKSSLAVVLRYWKQAVLSILNLFKEIGADNSTSTIRAIEKLILCDSVSVEELTEQVSCLSVSLINEASLAIQKINLKPKFLRSEGSSLKVDPDTSSLVVADAQILDAATSSRTERDTVIVLSDDEMDVKNPAYDAIISHPRLSRLLLDGKGVGCGTSESEVARNDVSSVVLKAFNKEDDPNSTSSVHRSVDTDDNIVRPQVVSAGKPKSLDDIRKEKIQSVSKPYLKKSSENLISSKTVDLSTSHRASGVKKVSDETVFSENMENKGAKKVSGVSDKVLKELVWDAEVDPWEFALKSARRQQSHLIKSNTSGPKRQVIQLNLPVENRFSHRLDAGHQRFKPPRLDDWYRPILEIDYFAAVGLTPAGAEENPSARKLKEVPVCFQSPDDYMSIFKPLLLEEFKAQLHSSFAETASLEEMSCGSLSVLSVERVDDFHVVRCVHDDSDITGSRSCLENDLILLTRQSLQSSSHDVHMVGKVERREKDNKRRSSILVIRFYLQNGCYRLNRARKLLLERSKWYISRLMTITPQLREFQALSSIKNIPLLPTILDPSNQSLGREGPRKDLCRLSLPLQQILKSSYNDSQLQAMTAAAGSVDFKKDFDLSLIQGPPGTGKTRTIVAIVSVLLAYSEKNVGRRPPNADVKPRTSSFSNTKQMSQSAAIARAWQDAALARQINEDEVKKGKSKGSHMTGRVLICAQSNAAVDELVSRISSNGLYGSDGMVYKPYLVRVGNAKTVHPSSLPFFIDTLVDHRLAEEKINDVNKDISGDSSTVIRSTLEKLVDRIRFYEAKRANLRNRNTDLKNSVEEAVPEGDSVKEMSDAEIEAKLRKLYGEKKTVYNDLATAQAKEKKANEESKTFKYKLRKSILKEAEIVVTTLSGCGGDLYGVCSETFSTHKFNTASESTLFDAVVIDEAAQALEPATLIPLQLLKSKGSKCIMVGDPKQLPATVLSNVASKYLFQCSMFERLQKAGHPVTMLTKQYRMHPEICRFPSMHFYEGKLLNGGQVSSKEASFHRTVGLGPYVFFDIMDGQELRGKNSGALSLYNECEADAAVELLKFFKRSYPSEFVGGRIGILTPYKSQLSVLRSMFSCAFGSWVTDEIEFNTVDGFQGREVDILILSTVRATEPFSGLNRIRSSSIGFVADVRRMNVALTRAKLSLWILGNARTLQTNESWEALLNDAKRRKLIISAKKPYSSMFSSSMQQNQVSESCRKTPIPLKHPTTVNEVSIHAEQEQSSNLSYGRKRNHNGEHISHYVGRDRTLLSTREDDKAYKKARQKSDLSVKKHHESVAENSVKRTVKDVKSKGAGDRMSKDESWRTGSGKSHLNKGDTDVGVSKGPQDLPSSLDHSEQVMHGGNNPPKLVAVEGSAFKNDDTGNIKIHKPSGSNVMDGNAGSSCTKLVKPMNAVSKRKQQRDAVDALLSSALISSKKSEPSLKSVPDKKLPTSSEHPVRPPKSRRGNRG